MHVSCHCIIVLCQEKFKIQDVDNYVERVDNFVEHVRKKMGQNKENSKKTGSCYQHEVVETGSTGKACEKLSTPYGKGMSKRTKEGNKLINLDFSAKTGYRYDKEKER